LSDNKMLSQAEIDALLNGPYNGGESGPDPEEAPDNSLQTAPGFDSAPEEGGTAYVLDDSERDALGEIGNISMGSASTTLSELLRQKVVITSPNVRITTQDELFNSFSVPYVVIQVEFKAGLTGYNILVIKLRDAMIMANLMMGGDGQTDSEEISEIELSAASEAMNQMIGSASTSLSTMFSRSINISPPQTIVLESSDNRDFRFAVEDDTVVVVSFNMKIGDLVDTEIMQVLGIDTAKREAAMMWDTLTGGPAAGEDLPVAEEAEEASDDWLSKDLWPGEGAEAEPVGTGQPPAQDIWSDFGAPTAARETSTPPAKFSTAGGYNQAAAGGLSFTGLSTEEQKKLELLLEVPLKVSVVLGRTKRPIKEVLNLTPGAIVELSSLVDEPVEVLVNGTLVAKGEVVVVNENFGVRITSIMSPAERLRQLKE